MTRKLTVCCVLRSGGEFKPEHAVALQAGVREHLSVEHEFVCLADGLLAGVHTTLLDHDWPGWWAMLEMFRMPGPTLYLDLDAVIVGSLDPLAKAIMALGEKDVLLLRQLSRRHYPHLRVSMPWTTGLSAWGGDLSTIYESFVSVVAEGSFRAGTNTRDMPRAGVLVTPSGKFKNDEKWTPVELQRQGYSIAAVQDAVPGVVQSYKFDVRQSKVWPTAPIVMFHGQPRPWDVQDPPGWLS